MRPKIKNREEPTHSDLRAEIPAGCSLSLEEIVHATTQEFEDLLSSYSKKDRAKLKQIRRKVKNRDNAKKSKEGKNANTGKLTATNEELISKKEILAKRTGRLIEILRAKGVFEEVMATLDPDTRKNLHEMKNVMFTT